MSNSIPLKKPRETSFFSHPLWLIVATFGAYFCMYGFRKPFTAALYQSAGPLGIPVKSYYLCAQVFGYVFAKWWGVKFIASLARENRLKTLLMMMGIASLMLLLFSRVPYPYTLVFLFLNGLALGGVFGVVLGYLEGRNSSEMLVAFLCASFILADGFTKTVGSYLLVQGVTETNMPFMASLLFAVPFLLFAWMLSKVPAPSQKEVERRKERLPMSGADRKAFIRNWFWGLAGIVFMYVFVTLLRSLRSDFAPELWSFMGLSKSPGLYTITEFYTSLFIIFASGCTVYILNHWRAFYVALAISLMGLLLLLVSLWLAQHQSIGPVMFMVLFGTGVYLPYVAVHTTLFERMVSISSAKGNLGFLMYVADSGGYTGYMLLLLLQLFMRESLSSVALLFNLFWLFGILALVAGLLAWLYFHKRRKNELS